MERKPGMFSVKVKYLVKNKLSAQIHLPSDWLFFWGFPVELICLKTGVFLILGLSEFWDSYEIIILPKDQEGEKKKREIYA